MNNWLESIDRVLRREEVSYKRRILRHEYTTPARVGVVPLRAGGPEVKATGTYRGFFESNRMYHRYGNTVESVLQAIALGVYPQSTKEQKVQRTWIDAVLELYAPVSAELIFVRKGNLILAQITKITADSRFSVHAQDASIAYNRLISNPAIMRDYLGEHAREKIPTYEALVRRKVVPQVTGRRRP